MQRLGNVTILEQPVRVTTLLSVIQTALKARRRQYEIRRQVESLRYQLNLTRTITHNATTAIFMIDSRSRCTFVNPAAEEMIGYQFEEICGRILHEIIHHHRPDGRNYPVAECPLVRALPDQFDVVAHEDVFIRRNGDFFPVLCNARPIMKGGVGVGTVIEVRDITERKQAQERERHLLMETARANAQFRAFFEQGALFAGIMDLDGTVIEANRLCLDACGYRRNEVIGKPFWECPWWKPSPPLMERIRTATLGVTQGQPFRAEVPFYTAMGTQRLVDLNILPIKDEDGQVLFLAPTGADITDRKLAERAILDRSQQLRRLAQVATQINMAHDVVSVLNIMTAEARQLIESHQAVATITNDQNWGQALNSVSLSKKYEHWSGYDKTPDGTGIYAIVCQTNQPMRLTQQTLEEHMAWRGFGKESANHPPMRGWLAAPFVGRDGRNLGLIQLSDRYEGEFTEDDEAVLVQLAQMASVAIENASLVESLRDADRRKDEFLATLAHELRNPLAPIRTGLEILKLKADDQVLVESIRSTMEGQTRQLVRLVDDLLDISRITSGKVTLRKENVELSTIVDSAVEASQTVMDDAAHQLTVNLPSEPVFLYGDPTRLVQILSNLLTNAARYTERGGRISLTAVSEDDHVVFIVSDSGIGIPAEMLEKIFDMFTQVNQSLERSHGGLGIGLTLVKRLVALHGGTVIARSEGTGTGSEFIIRLPQYQNSR
jgi:PAS domain S-box-containing protein